VGFVGCPVIPLFSLRGKKEKKEEKKRSEDGHLGEEGFVTIIDQNLCMLKRNSVIP
jgi:hypothetical protein